MDYIFIIGYFLAVLTGIVLGILGGGGSMLILPVFVYLLGISSSHAVVLSLFVVGVSSLLGASFHLKNGNVSLKTVLYFGIPSVLSVIFTRKVILPALPEKMFRIGDFILSKDSFLLLVFAVTMIFAAVYMIKNRRESDAKKFSVNWLQLAINGLIVGLFTGLVGAGGGFLIVPALIYFAKLPMKFAVGTSLAIISINSLIGFLSSVSDFKTDWVFLGIFTAITCIGIVIGVQTGKKMKAAKLKVIFGWFVLLIAAFILSKELFFNNFS